MKRLFKLIVERASTFLLAIGFGAAILLLIWVISMPPYPYRGYIGCSILGIIVGWFIGVNRK